MQEKQELPSPEAEKKEKEFYDYAKKLLLFLLLLTMMAQEYPVIAQEKPDPLTMTDFAAALVNVHWRAEYNSDKSFSWQEIRGAGSLIELDGHMWLLTVEHNLRTPDEVPDGRGGYVPPTMLREWLTYPDSVNPDTQQVEGVQSTEVDFTKTQTPLDRSDNRDAAMLVELTDEQKKVVTDLGITPFTNVERVTRETLDTSKYFYLISAFQVDTPPAEDHERVWITQLAPTTEDEYRKQFKEAYPSIAKNPKFASTELIQKDLLPFTVSEVAQPLSNFLQDGQNVSLEKMNSVALCESMSGSVVVQSDKPLSSISSLSEVTVIGVLSGVSYLKNPIPLLSSDEAQLFCSSKEDFVNVAPIS